MGDSGVGLAFIGFLFASAGYAALAIYLLRRGQAAAPLERVQATMLAAIVCSLAWSLAGAADQASTYTASSYVAAGFDLARYALWLTVLVMMLRPAGTARAAGAPRPLADWIALLAALLLAAAAAVLAQRMAQGQYEPDASRHFLLLSLGLPVLGLVLVEQVFRNLADDLRWSAKPVVVGLACIFAFDIYLYAEGALLARLDPDVLAIRPLAHLAVVPLLFIAARRKADWVRSIQVSRRAVFYSATLLLAGGYLLFLAAVGYYVRYFGGDWGRALQLGLLFLGGVGLVLLVLSASLRARVRVFIGKHFFSYRYDYREEWLAFTAMLSSNSEPQAVGVLVVRALANIVECPAGSLWTRRDEDGSYAQSAIWNAPAHAAHEPAGSSLVAYLHGKAWVIDVDEYRSRPAAYEGLTLPDWLAGSDKVWAVIPLQAGGELLGFVVLAPPRTPVDLNWEARDLLKTASRQAAGYLAQMRATEALLESRKFDAFNRMSAFVVHDLKNIVTQLSLMMKNAQRLRDNPEFQEDMLLTVESSLEKMRQHDAAAARRRQCHPAAPVAWRWRPSSTSCRPWRGSRRAQLEAQVADDLATRGHEERLERVLGHLVQNALDATPPSAARYGCGWRASVGRCASRSGDTGPGHERSIRQDAAFQAVQQHQAQRHGHRHVRKRAVHP